MKLNLFEIIKKIPCRGHRLIKSFMSANQELDYIKGRIKAYEK